MRPPSRPVASPLDSPGARPGRQACALARARLARAILAGALALAAVPVPALAQGAIVGHAIVRDDGTLLIKERIIALYGIYLASTDRQCRTWIRPVRCASQAVLALDFKVRGFVTCLPRGEDEEGTLQAICYLGRTGFDSGEDLGAYLIEQGWALALPYAPFEYHAAERIARSRGLGVWGYTVDQIDGWGRRW